MKKYLLPFFILFAFVSLSSCERNESSLTTVYCSTIEADEITITSATLNGLAVFEKPLSADGEAFFYYSTTASNPLVLMKSGMQLSAGTIPKEGGPFSVVVTGLEPATVYYYLAVVSCGGTVTNGGVRSFTTLSRPSEVIVTAEADMIKKHSALLYGYVDLEREGGSNAKFGIILSQNENPSERNGQKIRCYEVDRNYKFYAEATGLNSFTTYYYKAYLEMDGYLRVGEVKSFTTKDIQVTVSTSPATNIGLYTARLNGSLTIGEEDLYSKAVWFMYDVDVKTKAQLVSEGNKLQASLNDDGSFNAIISLADSEMDYSFIACAKVDDKTIYGDPAYFSATGVASRISIDGIFSDWTSMPSSNLSVANSNPQAPFPAIKQVKVHANKEYIYVYFKLDNAAITGVEHDFTHIYFNADNNDNTGGYLQRWTKGSIDFMCEGSLLNGGNEGIEQEGFELYKWDGITGGTDWKWSYYNGGWHDNWCVRAWRGNEYELSFKRSYFPELQDVFQVGFDINNAYDVTYPLGLIPNSAATNDNPEGIADLLLVRTVD